jgi:hypothetical protein
VSDERKDLDEEQKKKFAGLLQDGPDVKKKITDAQGEVTTQWDDVSVGDSGQLTPLDTPGMDPKKKNWKTTDSVHSPAASVDEATNQRVDPEGPEGIKQTTQGYEDSRVAHQSPAASPELETPSQLGQQWETQAEEQPGTDEPPSLEEIESQFTQEDWAEIDRDMEAVAQQDAPEPPGVEQQSVFERHGKRPPEQEQSQQKEQDRDEPER